MATLALAAVGSAVGSALLPSGISLLGASLTGAAIGSQIGALAGSYIDQGLFGPSGQTRAIEGPRLSDLHVTASTEGAAIPRVYGRVRVGGQIIWATELEEVATSASTDSGAGGGKGAGGSGAKSTKFTYYCSFAVAVAEGEVSGLGRVWANGALLDLSTINHRFYTGSPTQLPDSLIEAHNGAGLAPVFRDTAYIVFDRLPLANFGNRLPQLSFEINRSSEPFARSIRGIVVIPGSGEFVYSTTPVTLKTGYGTSTSETIHTSAGIPDWMVSMDQLEATLPNAKSVSLTVTWFGTDLRAGECRLYPGVERRDKTTSPAVWSVAGQDRVTAYVVSEQDGRPVYGGTPSDTTVIAAIRDLKIRGHAVTLTPFILMDVPATNVLPNPYGGSFQPSFPWRGRITVHPASGQSGSPDKSSLAISQIASFVGAAVPADFSLNGDAVVYSGPAEWSLRRMVLHQAMLAKAAGGISAFVIGSELRGLSTVRSGPSTYPFVSALIAIAADVKMILGVGTKVTYAADWSEYFGHHPSDGSNDVHFHLDPLWASSNIDAIGIDLYWPLSDWRDGRTHLDYLSGVHQIYDLNYLKSNVRGGEGFDWYYASEAARSAQTRSPITDGLGKPWIYRYKDIASWWLNPHFNRPGGIESPLATQWVPQSKPFWFMEVGSAAVDKASNEPNVFIDPKSSESTLPKFSRGTRDDLIQRRHLRALIEAFDPTADGYVIGANPLSTLTSQRMVDLDHIHVYAWDARPFPAFPSNTELWGDGDNWRRGHWLNGRAASAPLAETVTSLLNDYGFHNVDTSGLVGVVYGYVIDRVMSAREALNPFELAYFIDTVESNGEIVLRQRGQSPPIFTLNPDDLVESKADATLLRLTRGQETELPVSAKIKYLSGGDDYRQAVAQSRRLTGASGRVAQADIAIVMDADQAGSIADSWLFETWAARERVSFKLPPSSLGLEPGDLVTLDISGQSQLVRITEIGEHGVRDIEARSIDPDVYGVTTSPQRPAKPRLPAASGQPVILFLDLPLLRGDEPPHVGYIAALQVPWPGPIAIYVSPETTGYNLKALATSPSTVGKTQAALSSGPRGRWDRANTLRVTFSDGQVASASDLQVLAGRNVLALQSGPETWELLQFQTATLVAPQTYELSNLLRGQGGTDASPGATIPADSPVVLLDDGVTRIDLTAAQTHLPFNWRCGPADRDIGDPNYIESTHAFRALGLRPLSPVHVRGARSANGDLVITWIRRTRQGGDSWESADVPLAEDGENYEVDILAGVTIRRTIVATRPTTTYTAAQQITDFGGLVPACDLRLAQVSATSGRGTPVLATL
jgi:hypothetical protein